MQRINHGVVGRQGRRMSYAVLREACRAENRCRLLVLLATAVLALSVWGSTAADTASDWRNLDMRRLHSSESVNLREVMGEGPVLIVNTASRCGFTRQFEGLEALHQAYKKRGLSVIGVSSNDFRQELDEAAAADVCFVNFGVTFDMMAPVHVKGDKAHPMFAELARQTAPPEWNFNKYLLDREARVVAHFPSPVDPMSAAIRQAVERLLTSD